MMILSVKNTQTVKKTVLSKRYTKAALNKRELKLKRGLDPDNHVVSTNSRVTQLCRFLKEGTSKLTNKLYYFLQINQQKGRDYILTNPHILAEEINRSMDSTLMYVRQVVEMGIITVEKTRNHFNEVTYKIRFTEYGLRLMQGEGALEIKEETALPVEEIKQGTLQRQKKEDEKKETPTKESFPKTIDKTNENVSKKNPQNIPTLGGGFPKDSENTYLYDPESLEFFGLVYLCTIYDSLNRARARKIPSIKLSLPKIQAKSCVSDKPTGEVETSVSTNQKPLEPKVKPYLQSKQAEKTSDPGGVSYAVLREAAIRIVEILNAHRETPIEVNIPMLINALRKRLRSHFGPGQRGIDNLITYFTKCAENAFLMGKKLCNDGTQFLASMGFLLTPKTIEASWHNTGYFTVYLPKKTEKKPNQEGGSGGGGVPDPDALPVLTLEAALEKASDPADKTVKETLYGLLGAVKYQTWFHGTGFEVQQLADGKIDFSIASRFAKEYVLTNFEKPLKTAFEAVFGKDVASKLACDFGGL